ncbi:MAG: beta-ketoacyl synthase N-terminal-like domain-containing protein [Reinekea sp.]
MAGNEKTIVIAGVGMATPVGLSANDTYYTVRAGVGQFREIQIVDRARRFIDMATIPNNCMEWHPREKPGRQPLGFAERLYSLNKMAHEDLEFNLRPTSIQKERFPLYMGVPSLLLDRAQFIEFYNATEGLLNINDESIRIYSNDRAASLIALHDAMQSIKSGKIRGAYVGGCDSYASPRILHNLDRKRRLKTFDNLDAFIPGEGAGILLVTTEDVARQNNCPVYARLTGSKRGFEEGHLECDAPYRGDGLASCVTQLLEATEPAPNVAHIYTSQNGEEYWAKEWGTTYIRNSERFEYEFSINHPAECIGDTGAACGVIIAGLAAMAHWKGHIKTDTLVYASADAGERCAVLLG